MHLFPDIAAGLAGVACGALAGFALGRAIRGRADWWFWVAAAAVLLVGIGFAAYADVAGVRFAWIASIGLIAGGLTGLKYGSARVGARNATVPTPRRTEPAPHGDEGPAREPTVTRH